MRLLPPGHHGAATLKRGDRIDCGTMTVTAEMIDAFADMTGDRFEIHMSGEAARRHGFDARVAHGLLVLSLIDGLKNQAPAQFRARASLDWHWSFHRPVFEGDQIAAIVTIAEIERARQEDQAVLVLDVDVSNQHGRKVQSGINRLLVYH